MDDDTDIVILDQRVPLDVLRRLISDGFGDMVKYVVDVHREVIAIGGELHADAEQLLLGSGSRSQDLWGANYYPGRGRDDCIEFTALINIRPAQGNPGMDVASLATREQIRTLTHRLIGEGEDLT
jgi:hypothetical protein